MGFALQHKSANNGSRRDGRQRGRRPLVALEANKDRPGNAGQTDGQSEGLAYDVTAEYGVTLIFADADLPLLCRDVSFLCSIFQGSSMA